MKLWHFGAIYFAGIFITVYVSGFIASKKALKDGYNSDDDGSGMLYAIFWPPILLLAAILFPFWFMDWLSDRHAKSLYSTDDKPTKHGDRVEYPDEPVQ